MLETLPRAHPTSHCRVTENTKPYQMLKSEHTRSSGLTTSMAVPCRSKVSNCCLSTSSCRRFALPWGALRPDTGYSWPALLSPKGGAQMTVYKLPAGLEGTEPYSCPSGGSAPGGVPFLFQKAMRAPEPNASQTFSLRSVSP